MTVLTLYRKESSNNITMKILQVNNLCKTYGTGETQVNALKNVSFSLEKGTFCAVVGESGSGKSTLLNCIGALDTPTSGEIRIDGHNLFALKEKARTIFRRRNIGFIFQSFNLMGTMNAVENVALPLTFQGVPKRERMKRAKKMVHMVGLDRYWDHRPNQMSGGQQQRVGVARALVVNPEIIFADEPTGNLDSNTSREIMNLMQNVVREQKRTLIMVTHDNTLAGFADKIIRIVDGKIVDMIDNTETANRDSVEQTDKQGGEKGE